MNELRTMHIQIPCPGCGRRLSADPAWPAAVCPFCGVTFPVSATVPMEERQALLPVNGRRGARRRASSPPRRKRHTVRWLMVCAAFLVLGWGFRRLPATPRQSGRSLSAPAVTVTSRPAATPRPAASPGPAATPGPASTPPPALNGVSPEFRQAMDSYEAFFDEYIAFMQSAEEEETGFGFLLRYAEMMERYGEAMEALDAIDEEALSTADEVYYLEVLSRINRKLLAASAED